MSQNQEEFQFLGGAGANDRQNIIMGGDASGSNQQIDSPVSAGSDMASRESNTVAAPGTAPAGSAIDILKTRIREARKRLNALYTQDNDDTLDNALNAADEIARRIAKYNNHLEALQAKDDPIKPVNLRDIPRFQLDGQAKHFEEHPSFKSLEHFFSTFETVLSASGNNIEAVWKRYIQVSMHFTYKTWVHNNLLRCSSWLEAKALFVKHYGTTINTLERISELFRMHMEDEDTLRGYTNRFTQYVQEAGFPLESHTLAKFYQSSLLQRNQQQLMVSQMLVRHDADYRWTIDEIYECVLPILFVADEQNRGRKPRSGSGFGSPGSNGKRKATDFDVRPRDERAVTGFYCAKHGGNRAKHNTAECRSNIGKLNYGSLNNRPNRATSTATRSAAQVSSGADICFA